MRVVWRWGCEATVEVDAQVGMSGEVISLTW